MEKFVDIKTVRSEAERLFLEKGFYCSEAIVSAVRDHIDPDMPIKLIASASGFPIGVGKSKCMCGAISGSVICLGYFFGRTSPSSPQDPQSVKTLELSNEAQQFFRDNYRVSCCSTQTKGMDMASGEHREQCARFTGEMAEKTAEIIVRELGLEIVEG